MPQSLAKILVHTVFSTKDRQPFLHDAGLRDDLHHYIGGTLNTLKCSTMIVGGVEDHVHILSTLARTCEPAEMVKETKRVSSIWVKQQRGAPDDFAWQAGYGMFSIGQSQVDVVREYIQNQEFHHGRQSFQDEFRSLLNRYEIEFDERYVWE